MDCIVVELGQVKAMDCTCVKKGLERMRIQLKSLFQLGCWQTLYGLDSET